MNYDMYTGKNSFYQTNSLSVEKILGNKPVSDLILSYNTNSTNNDEQTNWDHDWVHIF